MPVSTWQLILQAGPVVKCVLLALALFSIVSWGIIADRTYYFWAADRESAIFHQAVETSNDLRRLLNLAKTLPHSPMAHVFSLAAPKQGHPEDVRRTIRRATALETQKAQAYLIFLATVGATAPFVGLFGTVWGIMNAFRGIGAAGSASLAVVAPGIAEALISTAVGLAAAIPAVMAYNYFMHRARLLAASLHAYADELIENWAKKSA